MGGVWWQQFSPSLLGNTEGATCNALSEKTRTKCGNDVTPVWPHITAYVTKLSKAEAQGKQRIKPTVYSEVLTGDDVVEKLDAQTLNFFSLKQEK